MKRGDFVTAAFSRDYGKPRPALIVQSDRYNALPSVVLCPLTSDLQTIPTFLRLTVEPSLANGLVERSQVAIDKIAVLPVEKIGKVIGQADDSLMERVTLALADFLDIG
jgi:mRNA interferase MazF